MEPITQRWPGLDDEVISLIEQLELYGHEKIQPFAAQWDTTGEFPHSVIQDLAKMGLMGLSIPTEYGGAGMSIIAYAAMIETLARFCASTAVITSVNNSLVCDPILKFGTPKQKATYLQPLASGQQLGCFALSEPGNGSDPGGLICEATRHNNGYRLKGAKNWITNGKQASICLVFANADKTLGKKGITAFLVENSFPGYSVAKLEHKLGINASSTAVLYFDDVWVPEENVLGKPGDGLKIALTTLDGGRIGIAAQALGIAQSAFDAAKKFSLEREQFGAPIARLQAIQWHIADMAMKLQASRMLIWDAARRKQDQQAYSKYAAIAKCFASEAAMWITTKAIQVHGGYGYTKEYPVERHFRDAKITEIYEGTSEIQRLVIAAAELKA